VSNPPKVKGTAFESSLLPLIREYHPYAERRALTGAKDKGDFFLPGADFILEAKCVRTMSLGSWLDEAVREAINAEVGYGIVVHKRKGKTDPAEQFATMRFKSLLDILGYLPP
jgi:hypothetical protein